jgi:hypothetical protein
MMVDGMAMQECMRSLAPLGPFSNPKWMDPQDADPLD